MCRKWKKEEKEMLRDVFGKGAQLSDVSIPGRKSEGIYRQAIKLKIIAPRRNPSLTKEQKDKLRKFRQSGLSTQQIANFDLLAPPKRTANAIQKACAKLGLVSKNRSRTAKKRKIWLNGEKQGFLAFLRQNSAMLATEQIAKIFRVKKETVACWQRRIGEKLCLSDTLALPYIRRKFRRVYREKSRKMLANFEKNILKKQKELEDLAEELRKRKQADRLEEKICAVCGKFWPRHSNFFFHATKRKNGFTCWCFVSPCKICVANRRREKNVQRRKKRKK